LNVDDLIIGLTIVAIGTSLPELAVSIIVLGNVLGSNLLNILVVIDVAGVTQPMAVPPNILSQDMLVMTGLTLFFFIFGYGFRGSGRVNRFEDATLLVVFVARLLIWP
jgi:cation:H+ antiporter